METIAPIPIPITVAVGAATEKLAVEEAVTGRIERPDEVIAAPTLKPVAPSVKVVALDVGSGIVEEKRRPPEVRFSENARRVKELKDKGEQMNLTQQELVELGDLFSGTMTALAEMFETGISLKMRGKSFTAMELFRMVDADRVAFEKKSVMPHIII